MTRKYGAIAAYLTLLLLCIGAANADDQTQTPVPAADTSGQGSAIDRRMQLERISRDNPFVLTPHRTNYSLVTYTDDPNQAPFDAFGTDLQNVEIKFQLSVKLQLAHALWKDNGFLYAAYTQKSLWQAFNSKESSPFRDTNHEPEIFLTFLTNLSLWGIKNRLFSFGINHQSNGQNGSLSRSWNRLFAEFVLEKGHFYVSVKPWWRIPEKQKSDPQQATGDDNPDITDYMGHGEFMGLYEWHRHRLGIMLRNNLSKHHHGAVQLDWTFPLMNRVRGYVQYFNGYGETLLDYNFNSNRLGIGVMYSDWL